MSPILSLFDIAPVSPGGSAKETFDTSVILAQAAERLGYHRVWYAEHHNMPSIASSSPAVLIAHIANHTETIRLGAGGVMLPNHSPLVVAETFGTLETLYPGRIDLGLGRAPGTDQVAMRALRRDPSADSFPQDVREVQGYLSGNSLLHGVSAIPGSGTNVPIYILGTSLFGAQLAAAYGLPYAFGSHFAPAALEQAVSVYRDQFVPSPECAEPYVMLGVNVVAAETTAEAQTQFREALRRRTRQMIKRQPADPELTEEQLDAFLASPQSSAIRGMLDCTAVGDGERVRDYLTELARSTGADELLLAHQGLTTEQRVDSLQVTAQAMGL